ncbi:MAG: hypothetical protein OCD02_22175 [Spirochaetaceae bacterium]
MKNIITTCDIYEACFYYINTCILEKIEVLQIGKVTICELFFEGKNVYQLRDICLKGNAEVNLNSLKVAYLKLSEEVLYAKKCFNNRLKEVED